VHLKKPPIPTPTRPCARERGRGGGARRRKSGRCCGSSVSSPTCDAFLFLHPPRQSPLRGPMADRKRKRRVGFAPTVCGPVRCRLLISLLRMESRLRRVQPTRPSYPRCLIRGMRSIKEPEPWTCGACGFENEPIHHLLFDLPPFHCKSCNADPPEVGLIHYLFFHIHFSGFLCTLLNSL
jgi:hypothetical protein